jgi:hypothetical protein
MLTNLNDLTQSCLFMNNGKVTDITQRQLVVVHTLLLVSSRLKVAAGSQDAYIYSRTQQYAIIIITQLVARLMLITIKR